MNNNVELLGYYGGDKTHSLSAWTSTFSELGIEIPEEIGDRIDAIFEYVRKTKKKAYNELLNMLASDGHHTPFEKSAIHFLVTTDIATHIQILKHRIAVPFNAESARYKELKEDRIYLPEDWKGIYPSKKVEIPYTDCPIQYFIEDPSVFDWQEILHQYAALGNVLYHQAMEDLTPHLGRKRTKESARFFKTYNSQLTADVMFNFRSFMHFQKLRNDEHAQLEIRELARKMLDLVKSIPTSPFKHSITAFGF